MGEGEIEVYIILGGVLLAFFALVYGLYRYGEARYQRKRQQDPPEA